MLEVEYAQTIKKHHQLGPNRWVVYRACRKWPSAGTCRLWHTAAATEITRPSMPSPC
ncbi:hypothetical protein J6590_004673 [Homalodisca vitripennis]|nr:hypothetical protein J6590_004673 [Homalodisca vitripennis]